MKTIWDFIKNNLAKPFAQKPKNVVKMLIAVTVMGMGVAILRLTSFGPDPCSAMNYGMSYITGMSFGNYQILFNIVLFTVIFLIDRSLLGLGTFGNMIICGYSADFTSWVILKIFNVTRVTVTWERIVIMLPALVLFVFAAAIYMNCDLGTAPYDAAAFLIHKAISKKHKASFKLVRIIYDGLVTVFAFFIKGEVGLVTVLMIFTLGPAVDFVGKNIGKKKQ